MTLDRYSILVKIEDMDSTNDLEACFTIPVKALTIGGGVLEAVLAWLIRRQVAVG